MNERTNAISDRRVARVSQRRQTRQTDRHRLVCHTFIYFQTLDTYDRLLNPIKTHFCIYCRTLFVVSRHSIRTLNRLKPIKSISKRAVPSSRSIARSIAIDRAALVVLVARANATMRARDVVEEDLSAYAREDLVYKAKLAEQAERCARMNRSLEDACTNGTVVGRDDGGCLVDDRARRADATERDRTRVRTRETTARAIERVARRVESSRVGSIRFDSIDRSNERTS